MKSLEEELQHFQRKIEKHDWLRNRVDDVEADVKEGRHNCVIVSASLAYFVIANMLVTFCTYVAQRYVTLRYATLRYAIVIILFLQEKSLIPRLTMIFGSVKKIFTRKSRNWTLILMSGLEAETWLICEASFESITCEASYFHRFDRIPTRVFPLSLS